MKSMLVLGALVLSFCVGVVAATHDLTPRDATDPTPAYSMTTDSVERFRVGRIVDSAHAYEGELFAYCQWTAHPSRGPAVSGTSHTTAFEVGEVVLLYPYGLASWQAMPIYTTDKAP